MNRSKRLALTALTPAGPRARLMIFTYHQVVPEVDRLSPGTPTAELFERQLQWIRKYCNPLPLSEAVDRFSRNELPARACVVTFDDGYANNIEIAAPLLKKYKVPAIVFVAVDAVKRGIMWNDIVVESMRHAGASIDTGAIGLGKIELAESNRLEVLNEILQHLKYRSIDERLGLSLALHRAATPVPLPRLMMEVRDLRRLADYKIDIGAHTVNHPILRVLDDDAASAEIEDSRSWLRSETGTDPTLFAYPNGKRGDDYDERHMDMVRELGFRAAVSTNWGCVSRKSSLFDLPRFRPWEDTEAGFYYRLCKVLLRSY